MQVVIDGLLSEYELAGHGSLVVWIHGWGENFTSNPLVEDLVATHSVLIVHLPGFGGSQSPKEAWGLGEYAIFVAHLLSKLELADPLVIIGHSNGGAIAIKGLSEGVLSADKLVLLASAGIRSKGHLAVKAIAKTGKLATVWLPVKYRNRLRQKLYRAAGSDLLVKPELSASFKKIIRQDIVQDAANIRIPTLLVYGQEDKDTPPSDGRILAGVIKQAELVVVPHAGHFAYTEQPDTIYKVIHKFID